MFSKILIANRGEIACRIIRTARQMGIKTVAVYSDVDAKALHVIQADEAVHVGPANALESYLNIEVIIDAAKRTGAEAIHPGYGFLSENPEFVKAVEDAGLVFIGPTANSIRAMGLKDAAKKLMEKAGVPVVPGYHGNKQDSGFLAQQAEKIGYPVLIKARAGGGGKGMRLVKESEEFETALEGAQREAKASFGDGRVLIEKYVSSPRHIEVQVFGDTYGNVVHLFERDCSLQRRHQKVIEEAPAPGMTEEMRNAMTKAAIEAAKAIDYTGAGTVEFIVDGEKGLKPDSFWFMEMNTRLQVEHPVTELVTGLDLVEWQLLVAAGERLPLKQDEIRLVGHSFEARVYAEDVARGFLPATGKLKHLRFSDRTRNDTGVTEGDEISIYYDPMIAKVVTHESDRPSALISLSRALEETYIGGLVTNVGFLKTLCGNKKVKAGKFQTDFIEEKIDNFNLDEQPGEDQIAVAAIIALDVPDENPLIGYRHWGSASASISLISRGQKLDIKVELKRKGRSPEILVVNGQTETNFKNLSVSNNCFSAVIDGISAKYEFYRVDDEVGVFESGFLYQFKITDSLEAETTEEQSQDFVVSPMPGQVKIINAKPGGKVSDGEVLVVLEAMKMEHSLMAPRNGTVEEIFVEAGSQVLDGEELVKLESINE